MATTMTRAEYEKKYGVKPTVFADSKVDTTPAPTTMTRAEYEKAFGEPPQNPLVKSGNTGVKGTAGALDGTGGTAVKEAATNLGNQYKGFIPKLSQDIDEGTADMKKGKFLKGALKTGLRMAGDTAGLVFAPIGAAIEATGINKVTDYAVEKGLNQKGGLIDKVTDIPAVQKFATKHPNAEEDFGRGLNLVLGKAEKSPIDLKTAFPRAAEQVKSTVANTADRLAVAKETRQANSVNKVVENRKLELEKIQNNYSKTRKLNDFNPEADASRQRIAETDVLVDSVDSDGTIRTKEPGGVIDKYKAQTIDGAENVVRKNLEREGAKVNAAQLERELTLAINRSGLEGADLIEALNGVKKEVMGLKMRADEFGDIPLEKIHDAKINTTKNINYQTPPETATYRKAVARAYKEVVEQNSKTDVKAVNKELQKYLRDIQMLEALDGRKVKGGKLGKYFAQVGGNLAGGMVGHTLGGPVGMVAGTVVGGEVASAIKGSTMEGTFGRETGLKAAKNAILEKAIKEGNLPKVRDLKTPDPRVGAGKSIPKTKEVYRLEKEIDQNVKAQKAAIKANDFTLVAKLKEVYDHLVSKLRDVIKAIKETPNKQGGFIRNPLESPSPKSGKQPEKGIKQSMPSGDSATVSKETQDLPKTLRGTKGLTADDIMATYPNIKLTKDVPATDIHGNKVKIPDGEKLTPYELKGNKILLQDGETYIVTKNQFANIKGNSVEASGKPFAPELDGLEETIKGGSKWQGDELVDNGETLANLTKNDDGTWSFQSDFSEGDIKYNTRKEAMEEAEMMTLGTYSEAGTKYSQYTLPGGENYREVLIKAPVRENRPYWLENKRTGEVKSFDNADLARKEMMNQEVKTDFQIRPQSPNIDFKSSHWEEPNVISHLRLNDRTYKGKKVAFMEELQSDWAREARAGKTESTHNLLKNWQTPTIKRALKEAVDSDAEYFSWINGDQTSARYNLATHINETTWKPTEYGRKVVLIPKGDKNSIVIRADKGGKIIDGNDNIPPDWKGKKLDEVLGKGLADKIMEKETGTLSGEGLKFGGEWASNLYDKQVKSIVEDLTGQKVEMLDLGLPTDTKSKRFLYAGGGAENLTPGKLEVGLEIRSTGGDSDNYIVTDILGDGKFKAIPKDLFERSGAKIVNGSVKSPEIGLINSASETFDISSKPTQQMGIKLTPEVKSRIKGEALEIKTSGRMYN